MFKLIKILNSHTNAPDLMTVKTNASEKIVPGDALFCYNGEATACPETMTPTYIAAGYSKGGSVLVFAVNSEMVFETTHTGSGTPSIGGRFLIGMDASGASNTIGDDEMNGPIIIHDTKGKKPLIRFLYV